MRPDCPADRHSHRFHRAHAMAGRPAEDTSALLRKARAVFLLRARQFTARANRQFAAPGETHYRREAIIELRAARLMHRLIMGRVPGAD